MHTFTERLLKIDEKQAEITGKRFLKKSTSSRRAVDFRYGNNIPYDTRYLFVGQNLVLNRF